MKVSVIIPTYNYAGFIGEAIESVCLQDYPLEDIEIIVVDDGSTDETPFIISSLQQQYPIEYHHQPNAGKAAATYKGIELATGDIIFNLDADDWFLPGKIKYTVNMFLANPDLAHIATPALIHYEDLRKADAMEPIPGKLLGRPFRGHMLLHYFFDRKMLYGGGSSFAARADILKQLVTQPGVDMYIDEWLLIETLMKGYSYMLPQPLSVWRVHGANYSGQANPAKLAEKQARLQKSSEEILRLIQVGDYPNWLKKVYRLKHEVRKMVWLEERGEKSIGHILRFLNKGILSGNKLSVLNHYHAFNRLVPGRLSNLVKGKHS